MRDNFEKLKVIHSKSKHLPVFSTKPDKFILSRNLSVIEIQTLFKLKCRMIDVADNFKSGKESIWCKMCSLFIENQSHLLSCETIRRKLKSIINFDNLHYDFISGNLDQQEQIAKAYVKILKTRENLLKPSNEDQSTSEE